MLLADIDATAAPILAEVRALAPAVAEAAPRFDVECRMPTTLMQGMIDAGVMSMAIPKVYGGTQMDPMAQVRVVEECARLDGSVGWIAMIGMSGGFQAAFLDPEPAKRMFGSKDSISAGQVSYTNQRAEVVPGGYRLSGRFRFASGITHASVLCCGVSLIENGQVQLSPAGTPRLRILMLPKAKGKVVETWDTTGLRGTGSHDFTVDDVFIPHEDSYSPAEGAKIKGPLYSYSPLFLVCHVGVPLGIARGVLDEARKFCKAKTLPPQNQLLQIDPAIQECIGRAETMLTAARHYTYGTIAELWATLSAGKLPSPEQRADYRMMIVYAHHVAKQIVDMIVEIAATSAVVHNSVFDRALRDIATASQHRQVHTRLYRTAGRIYLGLEGGDPSF